MASRAEAARAAVQLVGAGTLGCSALVILHAPDVAAGFRFLKGDYPTEVGVAAALGLLLWALIGLVVALCIAGVVRPAAAALEAARRSRLRSGAILVSGLVLLGAGAQVHRPHSVHICCGNLQQARQELP